MSFKKQEIKKAHDLISLIELCQKFDPEFIKLLELGVQLNPYAFKGRYPEDCLFIPDITLVQLSIKEAETILNFVMDKIED